MNVLFLSVSTGGGHFKAAEAIKEAIELKYPSSKILTVDSLKYVNPVVDRLVVGGYLATVKARPRIYKRLYEYSESSDNIYTFSKAVNNLLSFKIKNLVKEFRPSAAVCTHPFPLQMLSILKKRNIIDIPVIAVLTDFTTHALWVQEHVDAYVVAHEHMKLEMINRGVPKDIIFPYGIPVSSNFLVKNNRKTVLKKLSLEDKTTVLLMGGSLGLGEICETFMSLLDYHGDLQIVAITGENIKIKEKLEIMAANARKKTRILGYTDRVSEYMDASDIIITKPGGMTISEALVKQLPILVISPIPGQEERNAGFVANNGAAIRVYNMENLHGLLDMVLENPSVISRMKKAAEKLAKPQAGRDILNLIEKLTKNSNLFITC